MIRLTLAGAGLLLISALPAQAASFDCTKATTPFEKAICSNPELSAKDDTLAVAYATALGGLSKPALAVMKADQRSWLNFVETSCTDDAKPKKSGRFDKDGIECLVSGFTNRIEALEASRMLGERRFYLHSLYATMPDPDAETMDDYYWKVASKTMALPQLDGDSELAETFNAFVAEPLADFADRFPTASTLDGEFIDGATSDEAIRYAVDVSNGRRISLVRNDWFYGHGAAHGNYAISYEHFLVKENRPLETADIFDGKGWKKKLLTLVDDKLHEQLGEYLQLEDINDVAGTVFAPISWNITETGIDIQFQPYEVAAYAEGAVVVPLNWSELDGLLAEGAQAIAYGY